MLSKIDYITLKYFFLISSYQLLFYFNSTGYSKYLLLLNIFTLTVSLIPSIVPRVLANNFRIKLTEVDVLVCFFIYGYISATFKGVLPFNTVIFLISYIILLWLNIKVDSFKFESAINGYMKSIVLLVFVNFGFYLLGISSSILIDKYPIMKVRLLEIFGIDSDRFNFLIFSNFAYLSMLYCLPLIFYLKYFKIKKNYITILVCLFSLILLDARGSFFAALLALFIGNKMFRFSMKWQILFISIFLIIPLITNKVLELLELNNAETIAIFSRRDAIWNITIDNYSPSVSEFLFGYGYVGQYTSGISELYSNLFPGYGNQNQISVHNSYLQILIDFGIIGLMIFIISILKLIKVFKTSNNVTLYTVVIFFVICGVTDLSIQPNNINILTAYLFLSNYKFSH